ncbi:hypothetical protein K9U34_06015, partial [Lawsonia intracellularis]|nr:hypothetical protein [Lawsonia intracellularis]
MTKVGGSNPFSTLASMVGFSKSSSSSSSSKVAELKSKFEALGTLTKASPRPANGTQDTNRLSDRLFRGHYTVPANTASRVGGHLQRVDDNKSSSSAANVAKRAAAHSSFASSNPGLQGASGSSSGGTGGSITDQVKSRGITARNFSDSNNNSIGSGSSSGSILDQVRSQGITARGSSISSGNASGTSNVNDGTSSRDYGANVRNTRERFEAGPGGAQGESPGVKDAKEATKGVSVSNLRGIFEGRGGADNNQVGRSSGGVSGASGSGGAQGTGGTSGLGGAQGTLGSGGLDGGGVSGAAGGTSGASGAGGARGTADGITSPGAREAQETIKNAGVSV